MAAVVLLLLFLLYENECNTMTEATTTTRTSISTCDDDYTTQNEKLYDESQQNEVGSKTKCAIRPQQKSRSFLFFFFFGNYVFLLNFFICYFCVSCIYLFYFKTYLARRSFNFLSTNTSTHTLTHTHTQTNHNVGVDAAKRAKRRQTTTRTAIRERAPSTETAK